MTCDLCKTSCAPHELKPIDLIDHDVDSHFVKSVCLNCLHKLFIKTLEEIPIYVDCDDCGSQYYIEVDIIDTLRKQFT